MGLLVRRDGASEEKFWRDLIFPERKASPVIVMLTASLTGFDPQAVFGSITRLAYRLPLVTDRAMEARLGCSPGPSRRARSEQASSSTFAMISSQLCRRARQGQGIASAFGTPVHWGCNDSVVANYRRIPSDSRGGECAGARLRVRL